MLEANFDKLIWCLDFESIDRSSASRPTAFLESDISIPAFEAWKQSYAPSNPSSCRYLFYIDFIASLADEKGQNALRHLTELAPFLRVLGCYPMDLQQ